MNNITLSIIIPVFKVEKYIKQCVDSVLSQTYKNLEVILVDDGSPDKCPFICDEYAKMDSRVRVIHKRNGGLSDARNEGLKDAIGEYVIFLDSDDYYGNSNFLETVANATDGGSKDAVFFRRTNFYDNVEKSKVIASPYDMQWNKLEIGEMLYELAKHDMLDANASLKATKRDILQKNNLYFRKGMFSEDLEWYGCYIPFINSIALINKPDYFYRKKREGAITTQITEKNIRDTFYTLQSQSRLIRNSNIGTGKKKALLLYHSYYYYIILGLINNVLEGDPYNQLLNECKSYKWLSYYSKSPKTIKSAFILKLFGIKISSKIFGYYIKTK